MFTVFFQTHYFLTLLYSSIIREQQGSEVSELLQYSVLLAGETRRIMFFKQPNCFYGFTLFFSRHSNWIFKLLPESFGRFFFSYLFEFTKLLSKSKIM